MRQLNSEAQVIQPKYHHIAVWKLLLFSICTFGLYEIYWSYKSWKFVRERDQSSIWPFWRAVFAPLWFYSLAEDIGNQLPNPRSSVISGVLAFSYFIVSAAWRLPDPYWLVCFLSVLAIIPLVRDVDSINRSAGIVAETYYSISFKHIAVAVIGLPIFTISLVTSFGIIPNSVVIPGNKLPNRVVSMLEENKLLEVDEAVIYYYSSALFSYADDGNYFTEDRVVSYWREDGDFFIEQAQYQEIEDIEVIYTNSAFEDTQVTIYRDDGTGFFLVVSGEKDKDRMFVETLKRTWGGQVKSISEADTNNKRIN